MTRDSLTRIFLKIRGRLAEESERSSLFSGAVEVDESYFGARRVAGQARARDGRQDHCLWRFQA